MSTPKGLTPQQQVDFDAATARRLDPDRNGFQRAQDFMREKLNKYFGSKPASSGVTSEQQVKADGKAGAAAQRKFDQAARTKNISQLRDQVGTVIQFPIKKLTGLALGLTSSEDQSTKWRRLGYSSPEAYKKALEKYESETGKSAVTGKEIFTPKAVPTVATLDSNGSNGARGENRSGVTPVTPKGGTSPSFRTAVEQGKDGGRVPSSGNAGSGGSGIDMGTGNRDAPEPNNMGGKSPYERYSIWVKHHEGLARKVKKGSAGYDVIQQILNEKDGKPATTYSEDVTAAADDAGRTSEEMSKIMDGGLETLITPEGSTRITPSTPETTSDPGNPQDGASPAPTLADNIRTVRMDRIASEQDDNLRQHYATRTHKDVFDESTNSWKQVPIKR